MMSTVSAIRVCLSEAALTVERFGEKFWIKTLFPSLAQNFFPFSSIIRYPQTPQSTSRNRETAAATFDIEAENDSSRNLMDRLTRRRIFQLVFLHDNVDQTVDIKEVDEIDFREVKIRVENGDSVFITRKENEKIDSGSLGAHIYREMFQKL